VILLSNSDTILTDAVDLIIKREKPQKIIQEEAKILKIYKGCYDFLLVQANCSIQFLGGLLPL